MNPNLKKIIIITLELLQKKSWANLSLKEIKRKSKLKQFDDLILNKIDLLKGINLYFNFLLSLKVKNLENSTIKDMIFEVLMMRFDILQKYRKPILSIFDSFRKKPRELIFLLPSIIDSIVLMLTYAKVNDKGITGQIKIKGICIIYISTFFIWMKDESTSLDKTMIALDNYLNQAIKILKFIK